MWLNPDVGTFFEFKRKIIKLCEEARERVSSHSKGKTIFDALTAPSVPPEEKTLVRLVDESHLVLAAGLDTTARFLMAIVCYFVTYPRMLTKLRAELKLVWDKHSPRPTWGQLETIS